MMNAAYHHGSLTGTAGQGSVKSTDGRRPLPRVWRPLVLWFTSYSRWYLRRHFNSLSVSRLSVPPAAIGMPIVLYANHSSWWDPLVGLVLTAEFYPNHTLFAPIEAGALRRYKILSKTGFFGVAKQRPRGVREFLATAEAILHQPEHLLAVTPQGRFVDARQRPVQLQRGLGFLATRVRRALFVPLAVEYTFWEAGRPEILCRFGEPTEVGADRSVSLTASQWTAVFGRRLEVAQDALAEEACRRDRQSFENLLSRITDRKGVCRGKIRPISFTAQSPKKRES
jgi:1-acyl-sn-glycerol-3-phosphate acyltransferase